MARFKKDLTEFINDNIEGMAESHIECWEERYKKSSISDIRSDLYGHDDSLEIERAEEDLERKLEDHESEYLVSCFHNAVVKIFRTEYNRR